MPFGRHQGYTVLEIIKDRPNYISWLIQNTSLKFYESVHDELSRHLIHHVPGGILRNNIKQLKGDMYNWKGYPDYDHDTVGEWDADVPF